jgi:hypothetical protein
LAASAALPEAAGRGDNGLYVGMAFIVDALPGTGELRVAIAVAAPRLPPTTLAFWATLMMSTPCMVQ